MCKEYSFEAVIIKKDGMDAAFVEIPFNVKETFGRGRVAVHATFDNVAYDGQLVDMGHKNKNGSACHIIGVRKDIRKAIAKQTGDTVHVTVRQRIVTSPACATVDEYITKYSGEMHERMIRLREIILSCSSDITEKISWGMPTFVLRGNLVHFAAAKNHLGFYPSPEVILRFAEELTPYAFSKGAVQLPLTQEMPYALLRRMVEYRVKEALGETCGK